MKSLANEFFKTMAEGARKHQGEHSSEYELIVNALPPLKVVQLLGNHRRCASGSWVKMSSRVLQRVRSRAGG